MKEALKVENRVYLNKAAGKALIGELQLKRPSILPPSGSGEHEFFAAAGRAEGYELCLRTMFDLIEDDTKPSQSNGYIDSDKD